MEQIRVYDFKNKKHIKKEDINFIYLKDGCYINHDKGESFFIYKNVKDFVDKNGKQIFYNDYLISEYNEKYFITYSNIKDCPVLCFNNGCYFCNDDSWNEFIKKSTIIKSTLLMFDNILGKSTKEIIEAINNE